MNVRPEYIRYLDLPEMDIDPSTLPVEKRLFLVWVVNPLYATDQIEDIRAMAAGVNTETVYTVPEGYRLQIQAISSETPSEHVRAIFLTIDGNQQMVFTGETFGAFGTAAAIVLPNTLLKEDDSVQIEYDGHAGGANLTTHILGWLYEVAAEE